MPHTFDADALAGVLGHMNRDHTDDNLLIVRAFGEPGFAAATMTGFDGDGGEWAATRPDGSTTAVRVVWPDGPISERREVRREIVALYDAACRRLGVAPVRTAERADRTRRIVNSHLGFPYLELV